MKCRNCGAEIGNSRFCEFCGAQISYDMRREQEQVNKQGCPQCSSSNIQFTRENQGEIHGKNSRRVVYRTVGFCKDCGYTWYPSGTNSAPQKNNLVWWILGWIFFFPAPVMVLIWRKKNTWDIKVKIAVTVVFWILIFALGSCSNSSDSSSKDTSTTKVEETANNENSEQASADDKSNDIVVEQATNEDNTEENDKNSYSDETAASAENDEVVEKEEETVPEEPIEMNSLQSLFVSIHSDMTRDEIDTYIEENELVKYAFTHDSAYYIGYDSSAIRQRGRDREGEAVDINFVTSGDPDRLGMVKSAEYANHTGSSTHYVLKFEDGKFYYNGDTCSNGEEAMQKYLRQQKQ